MDSKVRDKAVEQGLDPEPRNRVDEAVTSVTHNPRRTRSLLHLVGPAFLVAGCALILVALWYTSKVAIFTITLVVGIACLIAGAAATSGIRDRLGQRRRVGGRSRS